MESDLIVIADAVGLASNATPAEILEKILQLKKLNSLFRDELTRQAERGKMSADAAWSMVQTPKI